MSKDLADDPYDGGSPCQAVGATIVVDANCVEKLSNDPGEAKFGQEFEEVEDETVGKYAFEVGDDNFEHVFIVEVLLVIFLFGSVDLLLERLSDENSSVFGLYVLELRFDEGRVIFDLAVVLDVFFDFEEVAESVQQEHSEGEEVETAFVVISVFIRVSAEGLKFRVVH